MTTKQEFSGKDVDAAISLACRQLDLPREQLEIEILSPGSAGIFGLCRRKAKILVTPKATVAATASPAARKPQADAGAQAPADAAAQWAADDTARTAPETAAAPGNTEEITAAAETQLTAMLTHMGFPGTVTVSDNRGKFQAHISGDHVAAIIGDDGQVLDAIQYLLRKILSKQFFKKVMITVDAGNYRAQRRQELTELAHKLVAEVKESGKSRTVPALNPAERRIVHVAIQNQRQVRSRSVGDGIFKKIVIYQPGKDNRRPRRSRNRNRTASNQ